MAKPVFMLRDIPKYETLKAQADRYPEIDPASSASCVLLLRVASDILAAIDDYLAKTKMSYGRWGVLLVLYRTPETPISPGELAEKAGVTRATMTGLIDGLERQSYVRRERVNGDRRMFDVRLTTAGQKYLDETMPGFFRLIRHCMSGIPEPEKQELMVLLSRLSTVLDEAYRSKMK